MVYTELTTITNGLVYFSIGSVTNSSFTYYINIPTWAKKITVNTMKFNDNLATTSTYTFGFVRYLNSVATDNFWANSEMNFDKLNSTTLKMTSLALRCAGEIIFE